MPASAPRDLHSSPTRRSSDLGRISAAAASASSTAPIHSGESTHHHDQSVTPDRKSTRLNSSHLGSSYAGFRPPRSTLFPYTTLFRSGEDQRGSRERQQHGPYPQRRKHPPPRPVGDARSEEHTSELQSLRQLVCRLPPPEIYTLPLHDALPIWGGSARQPRAPAARPLSTAAKAPTTTTSR